MLQTGIWCLVLHYTFLIFTGSHSALFFPTLARPFLFSNMLCIHTQLCVCVCVYICICLCASVYVYVYASVCLYVVISVYIYVHVWICNLGSKNENKYVTFVFLSLVDFT